MSGQQHIEEVQVNATAHRHIMLTHLCHSISKGVCHVDAEHLESLTAIPDKFIVKFHECHASELRRPPFSEPLAYPRNLWRLAQCRATVSHRSSIMMPLKPSEIRRVTFIYLETFRIYPCYAGFGALSVWTVQYIRVQSSSRFNKRDTELIGI